MKKIAIALAMSASIFVAACDKEEPAQNNVDVVEVDEECPRADGEPCR